MASEDRLKKRLAFWQERLLDLSQRNRLLNFRPTPTSVVPLTEPTPQDIFDGLVNEKRYQFYPVESIQSLLAFDEEEEPSNKPSLPRPPLRHDELRSDLPDKRLWRTLYSLRQKSQTTLQEQGVVTLFVTFGLLEWKEVDYSNEIISSPLLLVPVRLMQESSKSNYHLALFEDEVTLNPTLVHKLNKDFNLILPDPCDKEPLMLDTYFAHIQKAVQDKSGWNVYSRVYLCQLSFHKLAMYQDLTKHFTLAQSHPIVRALAGDTSLLTDTPSDLPTLEDLDRKVLPEDTFQILDADSSQQEAIQAAKRDISFVLQGPPGTGKSQTIANIIAERMAQGKKVLFVSEKMAALEVVYRRLEEQGLGEFCLEAHSHKANKKEVIQQLGRSLNPTRRSQKQEALDFAEFQNLRQRLNDYVHAMHVPRGSLQRTVYQAHGKLASLHSAPDMDFAIENVADLTQEALSRRRALVKELEPLREVIANYRTHPWQGIHLSRYSPNQTKADIRAHFGALVNTLNTLEQEAHDLAQLCGIPSPVTVEETDRIVRLAALVAETPSPPVSWLVPGAPAPLVEQATRYQNDFAEYRKSRNALLQRYREDLFQLPQLELIDRLTTRPQSLLERVQSASVPPADTLLHHRDALTSILTNITQLIRQLQQSAPSLAAACRLDTPQNLADITRLCQVAELILPDPKPQKDWFDRSRLLHLKTEAEEAKQRYDTYLQAKRTLAERYEDTLYSQDVSGLYARFSSVYPSPFRVFNFGYYRDMRLLRVHLKTPGKLSAADAIRDLRSACKVQESKEWIESNRTQHSQNFGRHYNALDTHWEQVQQALNATQKIIEYFGDGKVPSELIALLTESGQTLEAVRSQRDIVQAQQTRIELELTRLERIFSLQAVFSSQKGLRETTLDALLTWSTEWTNRTQDFYDAWDTLSKICLSSGDTNPSVARRVSDLEQARSLVQLEQTIQEQAGQLQEQYGALFADMNTRWEDILCALHWAGQVLDWFDTPPPDSFVAVVTGQAPGAKDVPGRLQVIASLRQRVTDEFDYLYGLFPLGIPYVESRDFPQAAFASVCKWLQLRIDHLSDLDQWMEFQELRARCQSEHLSSYLEILCRDRLLAEQFLPAFDKRFWTLWLDAIYQSDPRLRQFNRSQHEDYIQRFRELDQCQLRVARYRLSQKLLQSRPQLKNSERPTGEMNSLMKEVKKQRSHMPIRRLFQEMPNLLLALKPCLLMSPLSVATFLDPTKIEFDTVIFDEASQIGSEDAIGAILRGKQIIMVGDSKQLPPTRFFATGDNEDYDTEAEEDDTNETYESILDEFETLGLPRWMLKWHYRSRCEALIAFSNYHFYEANLITFPGPHLMEEKEARCVEFIHVPGGIYQRGKGQSAGINRVEARKVAELVFQHFRDHPDRSLGVIAFSERQQSAIDDEIRRTRFQKPEFERFFREDTQEPFFIKNLENVQGDERDTILFSVGYGKDQHSKLSMNFGPLNRNGGARRLNVAITRAKYQIKIVSSIQSHDFDLKRTDKEGPRLLKAYIDFAQHGPASLPRELTVFAADKFDSPFEEEVYRALVERGLTVHSQVGCAGYRIDLAVVDQEHPGLYLLGIECDGANYHSCHTARDRDRLRQQVLEGMGWKNKILRIWSSDWIRNRNGEIQRIEQALNKAREACHQPVFSSESLTENADSANQAPLEPMRDEDEDTVREETDLSDVETISVESQTIPYRAYEKKQLGTPKEFNDLAVTQPQKIHSVLIEVVQQEGPIHIKEATRRVIACWQMSKVGSQLLKIIERIVHRAQQTGLIRKTDDFLWYTGGLNLVPTIVEVPVRVPKKGEPARKIEYVPLEEIAQACYLCVKEAFAISQEDLLVRVARLLGYQRMGDNIQKRLVEGIQLCEKQRRIERNGDSLCIKTSNMSAT
jgi:very-short-patch-repair endonuclease